MMLGNQGEAMQTVLSQPVSLVDLQWDSLGRRLTSLEAQVQVPVCVSWLQEE